MGKKNKEVNKKVNEVGKRVSFDLKGVEVTGVVIAVKQTAEYTILTDGALKATITLPQESIKWKM